MGRTPKLQPWLLSAGSCSIKRSCHHTEACPQQTSHYFNALFVSGTEMEQPGQNMLFGAVDGGDGSTWEGAGERVESVIVFSDSIAWLLALSDYRMNCACLAHGEGLPGHCKLYFKLPQSASRQGKPTARGWSSANPCRLTVGPHCPPGSCHVLCAGRGRPSSGPKRGQRAPPFRAHPPRAALCSWSLDTSPPVSRGVTQGFWLPG